MWILTFYIERVRNFIELQLLLTEDPDWHEPDSSVSSLAVIEEECDRSVSASLSLFVTICGCL